MAGKWNRIVFYPRRNVAMNASRLSQNANLSHSATDLPASRIVTGFLIVIEVRVIGPDRRLHGVIPLDKSE